jgi:hypothetical protein
MHLHLIIDNGHQISLYSNESVKKALLLQHKKTNHIKYVK